MSSKRVFISYKRNVAADEAFVDFVASQLKTQGHAAFIDREMLVGEDWVRRISDEVRQSDFLVLVLSEQAMQSQMVAEEVRIAEASRQRSGHPKLLPVRFGYEGELPYDIAAILSRINYALWRDDSDTARVAMQIVAAVATDFELPAPRISNAGIPAEIPLPSANPLAPLEAPEGTMSPESAYYVERDADHIIADEQTQAGYTLTIQAARQMGKSSMLGRVMARARSRGKAVAFIDFQAFGQEALATPSRLYHQFCYLIEDALDLPSQVDAYWDVPLSETQKCRRFLERRILPQCPDAGLLLALDEADALLGSASRSDFFGMLRSWHNYRQTSASWRSFALAMAISTEPGMLIDNLSQSPFNVGSTVKPEDFTQAQCDTLLRQHGVTLSSPHRQALNELLRGHPYLTRKALYLFCKRRYEIGQLIAEAASETGPFGDHLRALLSRLHLRPGLLQALKRALATGEAADDHRHRLIAGGIIKEAGGRLVARNPLYDSYFRRVTRP